MDEILVSLKGMENSKSPGPDGLTKEFYSKFIDILKMCIIPKQGLEKFCRNYK
jgi:hypothetical protein